MVDVKIHVSKWLTLCTLMSGSVCVPVYVSTELQRMVVGPGGLWRGEGGEEEEL